MRMFVQSEIRLCQFPSAEPGVMTDMEFAVAVNELIHMHSVPLRTRLFKQALQGQLTVHSKLRFHFHKKSY